jgi:hypothetical protein
MPGPFTSPVALSVPFEPDRNPQYAGNAGPSGIASLNTQDAIEEAKADAIAYADTVTRWQATCAFDGTGSTGRWLAWMQNNPSNNSPLVVPRNGSVTELGFSSTNLSTTTITLFKNAVSTGITISTSAQNSQTLTGLNVTFVAGDKLSFRVTAGSSGRPTIFMFAKFS